MHPAHSHTDPVNFIVLFEGRSGSSFLINALNRLEGFSVDGEILSPLRFHFYFEKRRAEALKRLAKLTKFLRGTPAQLQEQRLRELFAAGPGRPAPFTGCKTKVSDIEDPDATRRVFRELSVRVVVLQRRNVVKQAISHLNARRLYERTGQWNVRKEEAGVGPQEMAVEEFDDVLQHLIFYERMVSAYTDYLDAPKLRLEYADLVKGVENWWRPLQKFLGFEAEFSGSLFVKHTKDDLRASVTNLDELMRPYADTEYAPMFLE